MFFILFLNTTFSGVYVLTEEYEEVLYKYITEGENYVDITIYVKPESNETRLVIESGELVFYTREPAEKGRANASLVHFLSKVLGLPISKIDIVHGVRSRVKRVRIYDVKLDQVLPKIAKAIAGQE